jgi:hypothetical protein
MTYQSCLLCGDAVIDNNPSGFIRKGNEYVQWYHNLDGCICAWCSEGKPISYEKYTTRRLHHINVQIETLTADRDQIIEALNEEALNEEALNEEAQTKTNLNSSVQYDNSDTNSDSN